MKTYAYPMPKVDIAALKAAITGDDLTIALCAINIDTGLLRASRPSLPNKIKFPSTRLESIFPTYYDYRTPADANQGIGAYVWRMLAFYCSPNPKHQCMPVTDAFYLPGEPGTDARKNIEKHADAIVDAVMDCIDAHEWKGVQRWGKVLGL